MAPIRRYLRITKYSVLECRIYLDNPALAQSWLLSPRDPVLPRVIEAVRPFVLPKLREERERSRKKSAKKRGIKDTVTQDDFEVSIFLTETSTRHSLLYKHKHFRDTTQTKLTSNSAKLTGASREAPIEIEQAAAEEAPPVVQVLREEDEDGDGMALADIPSIGEDETLATSTRVSKRRRGEAAGSPAPGTRGSGRLAPAYVPDSDEEIADDDDGLFVRQEDEGSDDDTEADAMLMQPPAKRRKDAASAAADEDGPEHGPDDKKKLAMDISYEGFAIYGRVLCLVVKRREGAGGSSSSSKGKGKGVAGAPGAPGAAGLGSRAAQRPEGQAVMENWITSTQAPADAAMADGLLDASS